MSKENLEKNYSWLKTATVTKMIEEALRYYGIKESYGKANNPTIIARAKSLRQEVKQIYVPDTIACCGIFTPIVAKETQRKK